MTSKLKRENNASSSFYKNKFLERQIHINLFYYLYLISSKNHLATDCKKNGEYQEIQNTGHMHALSGITFIFIPDKEPKYRTVRSNTLHLATLAIHANCLSCIFGISGAKLLRIIRRINYYVLSLSIPVVTHLFHTPSPAAFLKVLLISRSSAVHSLHLIPISANSFLG